MESIDPKRKIIDRDRAADVSVEIIKSGKNLVFTNGCFDLIHPGHVDLLVRARAFGDALMVGLNTDDSVRRLKGESRPVRNQYERSFVLAALEVVDWVVLFDDDTPFELLKIVKPSILVKGGDYTHDTVVGADFVESNGGRIEILPLVPG
ncbi:MAG: D-glycero-beta-D-manno-heptose 1-phosphate adenylyltransferase, partial [bacterium]